MVAEMEREDEIAMEKSDLVENVKKECKKLMEEAVTRKFIHTDSSSVTSLCNAVDSCVIHKLKKRVGGLLPPTDCSLNIISKLSKLGCPKADSVTRLATFLQQFHENKGNFPLFDKSSISDSDFQIAEKKLLHGFTSSGYSTKYLWIRIALIEKVLATIIQSLITNAGELYETDALLSDKVHGPLLVALLDMDQAKQKMSKFKTLDHSYLIAIQEGRSFLPTRKLDGPCSLDYSKMKTPENSWTDPSAQELVQRHKIYRSPSQNSNNIITPKRRRLFMSSPKLNSSIPGVPILARQHVDSLHQNGDTQLLYGKNNVTMSVLDTPTSVQGYLSLHKSLDNFILKWTPNPMLHEDNISVTSNSEKCHFWNQAITVDFSDVVYLHCHSTGDSGGSVVLISQDGIQLPPLSFPSGGSLLSFLTCLEQGLSPEGRLDPPLLQKNNSLITWPKLKKNILPDRLVNAFQDRKQEEQQVQDFVFRIVFTSPVSNIDKSELRKLLSTDTTPNNLKLNSSSQTSNNNKNPIPRMHTSRSKFQRSYSVPSKIALNLACEKMKHQILARAFHGWVASYRHLKTVRTHLASLVLQLDEINETVFPDDVHQGLTHIIWTDLRKQGLNRNKELIKQYIYHGGIEPSIRREVWPYLLDQYPFTSDAGRIKEVERTNTLNYAHILEECKSVEQILQEKEKDLLALNGFANGEVFIHADMDTESLKTFDTTDNSIGNETIDDNVSRDFSISSNISDPIPENAHRIDVRENEVKESPWMIKSLLDTKDNLREMVESASERGTAAWKKLMDKKNKKSRKRETNVESSPSVACDNELDHDKYSQLKSFDLELDCQTCGKKVIESRLRVSNGNLQSGETADTIECYACIQERKCNQRYEEEISPYKIQKSPSSVVFDSSCTNGKNDVGDYVVNINGEGTPLKKSISISSAESTYSENILKDYALNIHRIDKDVLRCDRNHPYFAAERNLEKLRNVIMCYVWEKLNIGYIQGMCDLCAPLLVIMDDEAKVYACFVKLMEKMEHNFPHGTQMDRHLANINSLIQILDPELHEILETHGDNTIFYFCYRWFLLDFKRELQYEDIYLVWETIWAASSTVSEQFNLFVALAMIELYREIIIDNNMDFTDIIKFFNEMAEQHDVRATLNLARNIVTKLQDIIQPRDAECDEVVVSIPAMENMEIEG